jgi:uncharacterized membrane protein
MVGLIVAAVLLLVTHFGLSAAPVRGPLVARLGEAVFRGLYSLISFVAFGALIWGYRQAPYIGIWDDSLGLRWAALLLMLPALVFLVSGLTQRNPTSAGQERQLAAAEPAIGIVRVTRHPGLWGFALWGLAHMLANGDVAALILFGTVALLGLLGMPALDAKYARKSPDQWRAFAAATSILPFAAILSGRQQIRWREIGILRPALALVLYCGLLLLHPFLFGVAVLSG